MSSSSLTTTEVGKNAERLVARYLQQKGHKLLALNWKIKTCEIDIITYKNNCVYFVEVKYRSNTNQGIGLDYITPSKYKRMEYAARTWSHIHTWNGEYVLCGASVSANSQIEYIEQI